MQNLSFEIAIIAAITSLFVALMGGIFSGFILPLSNLLKDLLFQKMKMKIEIKNDQRREIRKVISETRHELAYKGEELNKRYWNMRGNAPKGWLVVNGDYSNPGKHYFTTTVYRFGAFFAITYIVEKRMSYFDPDVCLKEDLRLLKMLKLLQQIITDVKLYGDAEYDSSKENSHIFTDNLKREALSFLDDGRIKQLSDIKNFKEDCGSICQYFDGYVGNKDDLKYERNFYFNISLICFLNHFGYDWQMTSQKKIVGLIQETGKLKYHKTFIHWIKEMKLEKEFKVITNGITKVSG